MKFKFILALAASLTIVSCSEDKGSSDVVSTEAGENVPSKVSSSLAPVAQVFDGEKYAPTELGHHNDYFVLYFTASW